MLSWSLWSNWRVADRKSRRTLTEVEGVQVRSQHSLGLSKFVARAEGPSSQESRNSPAEE